MVLRRLMGWEMIDMTYARMMETKAGSRRWDGKDLKNVPHFDDLSQEVSGSAGFWVFFLFFFSFKYYFHLPASGLALVTCVASSLHWYMGAFIFFARGV